MSIIAVASAKGGVGKSSFAVGVGGMLASHGKSTLLIDMDIGVRSLDLLLGVAEKTVYNWGDILVGNCDINKAAIKVSEHLSLLAAPVNPDERFDENSFKAMADELKKKYDFIILDSPAGLDSGFKLSAQNADMCVIVTNPDRVSIRAASFAALSVRKSCNAEVRLVINRFNKKVNRDICIDDIIDTTGARLLGIVPESPQIGAVVNGAKLPYDCKGNLAYLRISQRLCGENVKLNIKNL